MEETRGVHALDYVSVFQRRQRWLVAPIVLSIVVGLALVKFLPKEYKSSATLGIAAPSVSPTIVSPSTGFDNEERVRAISQQLMSPMLLARVAHDEGLGSGALADPAVARLRKQIEIAVPDPVANTNEPRRLDAFVLSYNDSNPDRAQRVTNRLANVFVEENSKTRTLRAEDTSAFLSTQLQASQARLTDLEGRLRQAKEAHMGQLPEQTQANLQTLNGLRQQMQANATALRAEQDRLSMIERQIESMQQGSDAVLYPHGPGEAPQTPEARVVALQRDLAAARAMYTDKHPEVMRLQDELAQARKDAVADRARPAADRMAQLKLDPSYRQLSEDREMARLRIHELERAVADADRQIKVYQARVEQAPMVEQQLASVERDYQLEKTQYGELSAKLRSASIAENVERNRRGEQFTVLYSASFPLEPVKPIPLRVMLMSILGGICLGAGLTFAREYFDRSVHDVRDLRDEFELPVLGEIAHIETT